MQKALSRPEMAKPTSQVQRVEPRRCVQWDGRTEAEEAGVVVADGGRGGAGGVVEGLVE